MLLGVIAILCIAGVCIAVSRSRSTPSAGAVSSGGSLPTDLADRATALCRKLEAAGVANNCSRPVGVVRSGLFRVTFDPTPDAPQEGAVSVFFSEKDAKEGDAGWPIVATGAAPSDDYPNLYMTSGAGVRWGVWRITWGTARWQACRAQKAVAVCASQYPIDYDRARRTYDIASRIADEE
jgi:hypothetical protein